MSVRSGYAHFFEPSQSFFNCATRVVRADCIDVGEAEGKIRPEAGSWIDAYTLYHEYAHFLQYYTTTYGYLFHASFEQYLMCTDLLAGEGYAGYDDLLRRAPLLGSEIPHPTYEWLIPAARHFKRTADALGSRGSFAEYLTADGRPDTERAIRDAVEVMKAPFPYVYFVYREPDDEHFAGHEQADVSTMKSFSNRKVLESHAHALAYLWMYEMLIDSQKKPEAEALEKFFEANAVGPYRPFKLLFKSLASREAAVVYCILCDIALNPAILTTSRNLCASKYFEPTARLARYAGIAFQCIIPPRGGEEFIEWQHGTVQRLREALSAEGIDDISLSLPQLTSVDSDAFANSKAFDSLMGIVDDSVARIGSSGSYLRPLQRWSGEYYRTARIALRLRLRRPLLLGGSTKDDVVDATNSVGWPAVVSSKNEHRAIIPRAALTDRRDSHWFFSYPPQSRAPRAILHVADWITMLDRVGEMNRDEILRNPPDHSPEQADQLFWRFTMDYETAEGGAPIIGQWPEIFAGKREQSPAQARETN